MARTKFKFKARNKKDLKQRTKYEKADPETKFSFNDKIRKRKREEATIGNYQNKMLQIIKEVAEETLKEKTKNKKQKTENQKNNKQKTEKKKKKKRKSTQKEKKKKKKINQIFNESNYIQGNSFTRWFKLWT
jgi:Mg-chelatase subunit ChlI